MSEDMKNWLKKQPTNSLNLMNQIYLCGDQVQIHAGNYDSADDLDRSIKIWDDNEDIIEEIQGDVFIICFEVEGVNEVIKVHKTDIIKKNIEPNNYQKTLTTLSYANLWKQLIIENQTTFLSDKADEIELASKRHGWIVKEIERRRPTKPNIDVNGFKMLDERWEIFFDTFTMAPEESIACDLEPILDNNGKVIGVNIEPV